MLSAVDTAQPGHDRQRDGSCDKRLDASLISPGRRSGLDTSAVRASPRERRKEYGWRKIGWHRQTGDCCSIGVASRRANPLNISCLCNPEEAGQASKSTPSPGARAHIQDSLKPSPLQSHKLKTGSEDKRLSTARILSCHMDANVHADDT